MIAIEFLNLRPGDKIQYRLRNGLVFNVRKNKSDTNILIDSVQNHVYDKHFKIGPADTVIDIGSNVGTFSVYAASVAKSGKVYSFEPGEENFEMLEKNVKLNRLPNVKTFKLGVGDRKKKAKLFLAEEAGQHSVYAPQKATGKYIIAQFVTLKQVFEENNIGCCDFLKMDCEGAEYEILFNCPEKILERIKHIAMEFHDFGNKYDHLQLKQYLEEHGFSAIISDEKPEKKTGMLYAVRKDVMVGG